MWLELLGLVEPGEPRRAPVPLPAWWRWVRPWIVPALAAASVLALAIVRVLVA
jgi:hypothetical protein